MAEKKDAQQSSGATEQNPHIQAVEIEPKYASTITIQATSNDFVLNFMRGRPAMMDQGKGPETVMLGEVTAVIAMSPQTLKDLYILIGSSIEKYEADYGEIETDFTRKRAKEKSS